jgi:uncharacterized protein (TIGR04255 family)
MRLQFPRAADDVRLLRSPLVEVICQVRFPPVLVIAAEDPAEFQEHIRKRFPLFEVEQQSLNVQVNLASGAARPIIDAQSPTQLYRFLSDRSDTTVTLVVDLFDLSTNNYTICEHFAEEHSLFYDDVSKVYSPAFATRIGLRYVDHISPTKLGLSSLAEAVDLLRNELSATYRTDAWNEPVEMISQLVLGDEERRLGLRFGKRSDLDEPIVILDFDCFEEGQLRLDDLIQRCNNYHQIIYDAFRWSIREERFDVFRPVAKERVAR